MIHDQRPMWRPSHDPATGDTARLEANMSAAAEKSRMREAAVEMRRVCAGASPEAGEQLRSQVQSALTFPTGAVVSGYWPMRDEIDPRPLLAALHARGHPLCLPVVTDRGRPLLFRRWRPEDPLERAAYDTRVPPASAAPLVPQVLLVPLLAFDAEGYRLGYGGGYYDRTLAELRAAGEVLAVGVAFAGQQVRRVPHDGRDERLDRIATERAVLSCG